MIRKLLVLIVSLSLCLVGYADSLPIDFEEEIEPIDEFPIAVDMLEEFIQSYYALLDSEEYLRGFSFLQIDKNVIANPGESLRGFLYKLMELRSGLRDKVTVYQIGDSHIKSGYFATTARSSLVEFFGASLNYQFSGVNGGSYLNLLNNSTLFAKAADLKPDLLVISLGTNDAQGTYNATRFRSELRNFMDRMRGYQGDAAVLFTLPPDGFKKGKQNADIAKVAAEISDYAFEQGHSVWNLGEVMGGKSSISQWLAKGLASQDRIHFSPQGYMLQGHLFYDALMKAYKLQAEGGSDD